MIIVEGSDKVGKTTLCEKIASKTGGKVHHWGLLPDDHDFYFSYLPHMGWDMIWDRGHYSELAYQAATGRPQRVTRDELRMVDSELFRWGCVYVIVTANTLMLRTRLLQMADDKFNSSTVVGVNNWFYGQYNGPLDWKIHCNYTDRPWPTNDDVYSIIAMHTERMRVMRSLNERLSKVRSTSIHSLDSRVSGLRD